MKRLFISLMIAVVMVGCSDNTTVNMAPENGSDIQASILLSEKEGVDRALKAYGDFFEESSTIRSRSTSGCKVRLYGIFKDIKSGWREKEYDFYLRNGTCFSGGKRFIVDLYPPK